MPLYPPPPVLRGGGRMAGRTRATAGTSPGQDEPRSSCGVEEMKRTDLASVAEETLAILHAGQYRSPSGRVVSLGKRLRQSKDGTCSYPPDVRVPVPAFRNRPTRIEVVNASTLDAARVLADKGHRVAALNFA